MNRKILIIDDEVDILEPLALILRSSEYNVETVSDGDKIISKIAQFKPDLIILDVLISGTDGREICRQLKNSKNTNSIPILIMSAHPGAEKDAEKSGADGFIAKPFDLENLLTSINKTLNN